MVAFLKVQISEWLDDARQVAMKKHADRVPIWESARALIEVLGPLEHCPPMWFVMYYEYRRHMDVIGRHPYSMISRGDISRRNQIWRNSCVKLMRVRDLNPTLFSYVELMKVQIHDFIGNLIFLEQEANPFYEMDQPCMPTRQIKHW